MLSNSRLLQEVWLETTPADKAPSDDAETSSTKRDSELWFEDGNLILCAGDVEFKVYRGPLIAHSLVFRDMLSLPQPPAADRSSSEHLCPVIPLHDSPDDLRHALRVFVPGSSLRSVV